MKKEITFRVTLTLSDEMKGTKGEIRVQQEAIAHNVLTALWDKVNNSGLVPDDAEYYTKRIQVKRWNFHQEVNFQTAPESIKPTLYRVKFVKPPKLMEGSISEIVDGYAAVCGVIQEYTRGEALKKAKIFGAKIERV